MRLENPFIPPRMEAAPGGGGAGPPPRGRNPFTGLNRRPIPVGMNREQRQGPNGELLFVQADPPTVTNTVDAFEGNSAPSPPPVQNPNAPRWRTWIRDRWTQWVVPAPASGNADFVAGYNGGDRHGYRRGCTHGCLTSAAAVTILGCLFLGVPVLLDSCQGAGIIRTGSSTSISFSANTCQEIPANSVIEGDVNVGGHIENGKIVGGTNLYDTGQNSGNTGLVLLTTASADVCSPYGASGTTFSNATDAQNEANTLHDTMVQNGCNNGCSGGVTIKDQNNNVIRR